MATTPNYSWVMPDPTDFVTQLPADFEIFGDAVDATVEGIDDRVTDLEVITTEGDLIVGNATGDPVRLPVGTIGQLLASDGDTLEYINPPSAGAFTLLSTTTLSAATTQVSSISGSFTDLYIAVSFRPATDAPVKFKFNTATLQHNHVSQFITTATTTPTQHANNGQTDNAFIDNISFGASFGNNFAYIYVRNYSNSIFTGKKSYEWGLSGSSTAGANIVQSGRGNFASNNAITDFSMITTAASFQSGTLKIFGVN